MTNEVDTHDPAGMARWLRERAQAAQDFLALDSEAQQRQYLNKWQQNVLPHLAFRFKQAAEMVEELAAECDHLRSQIPNMPADEPTGDWQVRLAESMPAPVFVESCQHPADGICPTCHQRLVAENLSPEPELPHEHEWGAVNTGPDGMGYRCIKCGETQ